MHVKDGVTRVRYLETQVAPVPAQLGFATLGSLAGATTGAIALLGGVPIAKAMEVTAPEGLPWLFAIAALVGFGTAAASFVGLWRRYKNVRARREAFADEVVAYVTAAVRARIDTPDPPARVESAADEIEVAEHELPARDRTKHRE